MIQLFPSSKKAQSATEFVVLISFMFIVFFIFFFAIQSKIVDATQAQDRLMLKEANNLVIVHLDLARQSYVDFSHSFILPDLGNFMYSVELEDNNTVVSTVDDKEYVNFLPYEVKGFLNTGSGSPNTVYHLDGVVETPPGVFAKEPAAAGIFVNINPEKCFYLQENGDCNALSVPSRADCQQYVGLC